MDYPRIPHPIFYQLKPSYLDIYMLLDGLPLSHLPEEFDSFLLFGKVIRLHINLFHISLFA